MAGIERSTYAERLTAACVLSTVGGFLDIYTYLYRGKVFANAVTGNMVLFGLNLAQLNLLQCGKYLLAIMFYAGGVFTSECIHKKISASKRIGWHQFVLVLEIMCLFPIVFIPCGYVDFMINSVISFVCALQVQTFRRVHGLPFASTMCTGNLRSGTEALFLRLCGNKPAELDTAIRYYLVIVFFITGAVTGAVLLKFLGHIGFLLAPIGLMAVFLLLGGKRLLAKGRRLLWTVIRK